MAYSPILVKSEKKPDGMTYLVVDFVSDSGQITVQRRTHTANFTDEWYKIWCKKQVDLLDVPEDPLPVPGPVDLTGVTTEPDAATVAQRLFDTKYSKLRALLAAVEAGVNPTWAAGDIAKLQGELTAAAEAKKGLILKG